MNKTDETCEAGTIIENYVPSGEKITVSIDNYRIGSKTEVKSTDGFIDMSNSRNLLGGTTTKTAEIPEKAVTITVIKG